METSQLSEGSSAEITPELPCLDEVVAYNVLSVACPTRQVISQLGQKWASLVVLALEGGPLRFGQLQRAVGEVTQKMLTQTLRGLERDGFLTRRAFATVPVTVEYELTGLGRDLLVVLAGLRGFAYARMPQIETARAAYDQQKSVGARQ